MEIWQASPNNYVVRFTEEELHEIRDKVGQEDEDLLQALETWITNGIEGD